MYHCAVRVNFIPEIADILLKRAGHDGRTALRNERKTIVRNKSWSGTTPGKNLVQIEVQIEILVTSFAVSGPNKRGCSTSRRGHTGVRKGGPQLHGVVVVVVRIAHALLGTIQSGNAGRKRIGWVGTVRNCHVPIWGGVG